MLTTDNEAQKKKSGKIPRILAVVVGSLILVDQIFVGLLEDAHFAATFICFGLFWVTWAWKHNEKINYINKALLVASVVLFILYLGLNWKH